MPNRDIRRSHLGVRFTADERARIERAASTVGLTLSTYVRAATLREVDRLHRSRPIGQDDATR